MTLKHVLLFGIGIALAGCSVFKPVRVTERHFQLTSMASATAPSTPSSTASLSIGIGPVRIAPYLLNTSIVIRKGTNEIGYSSSILWAERLDHGVQRVLADNLSVLVPNSVRLAPWESGSVAAEVYVDLEQLDVDAQGQGVLTARWRIVFPGSPASVQSGQTHLTLQGPVTTQNPAAAVTTQSQLLADLSQTLAKVLTGNALRKGR